MTDRHNGYIVVLEKDIREDDAEATIAAIMQIKGVLKVVPQIADVESAIAESRAHRELLDKLFKVLNTKPVD